MARKKELKKEGVSKVTIYKLDKDFPVEEALSEYDSPKSGTLRGWNFKIFIKAVTNKVPAWKPLINDLINNRDVPKNSYASLVILFNKNQSYFALTAGYGYVDVKEHGIRDFGIDIACKSLDPNELDHLYQKVPTGNVYGLSRSLRGKYIPTNDQINERSVLKALRGKVINEAVGIKMEGRTSLAISGKKDLSDVIALLDEIIKIEKSNKYTVHIKGLEEVSKTLKEELELELLNKVNTGNFDDVLFGYEDDLVFNNCEQLKVGRDKSPYPIDDTQGVINSAKKQNNRKPALVRITGYNEQGIVIFNKRLIDLIEGEIDYKGNKYFRIDKKWYKTNIEYRKKIEEDFRTVATLGSTSFQAWPKVEGRFVGENEFLNLNVGKNRFLAHTKKIAQIELADIIDTANKYLIHVKKGKGAYLRILFAQGFVSASLLNSDETFKKEAKNKFGIDAPHKYTIVFAIFPEEETNINSIFTLFAKVDFLERYNSLREMGFDVKYCLIK